MVDEELGCLIGVAGRQVREEGGATGGGDDARGHHVLRRVCSNLGEIKKGQQYTLGPGTVPYSPVIRRLCLCLHRKEMGA